MSIKIKTYGYRPHSSLEESGGIPARVTSVHRNRFGIVCDHGAGWAILKTGAYYDSGATYPTVGDFVLLDWQADGNSRILQTLPRRSYFARLDPASSGHREQAVAANFDYVFILQSLDRDFNLRRLERYLTLAWQSGAVPAVLLTKADCPQDYATDLRAAEKLAAGVGVFAISAKTGLGLDQLSDYLKPGKTIVFLGSSGVGKSTLINTLAGEVRMPTSDIREKDGRGRHTTTHRQLLLLPSGVMVIDTPGMRELGMWQASEGLGQSFSDVEQYLGSCKFSDCRHQSEPGCAIREAIRNGALAHERWESYVRLQQEAKFTDDKAGYLREKQQWHKELSKMIRQQKKEPDYRHTACTERFSCASCGQMVTPEDAGSAHRNHCPHCLVSLHVDHKPGDRASLCRSVMDPIGVWVRKDGEWSLIHRCRGCGTLHSNRIAADDNSMLLMSIAMKPLAAPPFPLWQMQEGQTPPHMSQNPL